MSTIASRPPIAVISPVTAVTSDAICPIVVGVLLAPALEEGAEVGCCSALGGGVHLGGGITAGGITVAGPSGGRCPGPGANPGADGDASPGLAGPSAGGSIALVEAETVGLPDGGVVLMYSFPGLNIDDVAGLFPSAAKIRKNSADKTNRAPPATTSRRPRRTLACRSSTGSWSTIG